jgi:hypothetical protein
MKVRRIEKAAELRGLGEAEQQRSSLACQTVQRRGEIDLKLGCLPELERRS